MKNKHFLVILILLGLTVPFFASAFLDGPIVPCGRKEHEGTDKESCTLCDFFVMAKNIVDFLLDLVIIIAPVFILAGGVVILTAGANPDQVGLGKKIILNAIIGVVIALLAWTILSMLFNALIGGERFPLPWYEFDC